MPLSSAEPVSAAGSPPTFLKEAATKQQEDLECWVCFFYYILFIYFYYFIYSLLKHLYNVYLSCYISLVSFLEVGTVQSCVNHIWRSGFVLTGWLPA